MSEMKDPFHEFKRIIIEVVIAVSLLTTSVSLVYLIIAKAPLPVQVILMVVLVLSAAVALIPVLSKYTKGDDWPVKHQFFAISKSKSYSFKTFLSLETRPLLH